MVLVLDESGLGVRELLFLLLLLVVSRKGVQGFVLLLLLLFPLRTRLCAAALAETTLRFVAGGEDAGEVGGEVAAFIAVT